MVRTKRATSPTSETREVEADEPRDAELLGLIEEIRVLGAKPAANSLRLVEQIALVHERYRPEFTRVCAAAGIKRRRSYNLLACARALKHFPHLRSRLEGVGLTKLELVAREINPRNVDERLELAETHTVKQLADRLKNSTRLQNSRCVMLYFSADEYDRFAKSLMLHGARRTGRQLFGQEEALLSLIDAGVRLPTAL